MARDIKEIASLIKESFINNDTLAEIYDLKPGQSYDSQFSNASVETCLIYVVATAIATMEWLFDLFKSEIEESVRRAIPGSLSWYWNKVREFRYGYNLNEWGVYEDNVYYEAIPTIKYCAITEDYNGLTVKVNKDGYEILTKEEMASFSAYMGRIKFAGTNINIVSLPPDELTLKLKLDINPMVLTPDYSFTSAQQSQDVIVEAVASYLADMKYGGVFNKTKLIDAIQSVDGVEDVVIKGCSITIHDSQLTTIELNDKQNYTSASGSIRLNRIIYEREQV